MIAKERLKELIEKGATIFGIDCVLGTSEMREIALNEDMFIGGDYLYQYDWCIAIKDLYETQEQAEWVAKMHTERTEKFCPPIYEQWLNKEIFEFYSKDHKNYAISVCIEFDFFESPAKDYIEITNVNDFDHHKLFCAEKTKENYEKAVLYAKALFEGKENDNETDSDR